MFRLLPTSKLGETKLGSFVKHNTLARVLDAHHARRRIFARILPGMRHAALNDQVARLLHTRLARVEGNLNLSRDLHDDVEARVHRSCEFWHLHALSVHVSFGSRPVL